MELGTIVFKLNSRFAEPLPEYYTRRIVVWIDEENDFVDKLDEIKPELKDVEVIVLTNANRFDVKRRLANAEQTGNILLYRPFAYDSNDDNWLLDVELYSEEFRADLVSMCMDELGVPQTPNLRYLFKKHQDFFEDPANRNKLHAQNKRQGFKPTTPTELVTAIMAALAGVDVASPNTIVRALLKSMLAGNSDSVYQKFIGYGVDEVFWEMATKRFGYQSAEPDFDDVASHLLLTATTQTLNSEFLVGLDSFLSIAHQSFCYDFVAEWSHSDDSASFRDMARYVEDKHNLHKRFQKLQLVDLLETDLFPCVDEVILLKIMTDINNHIVDVDAITTTVEKRRARYWYDDFKHYYEGVLQVARMQAFFNDHSSGFHTVEPTKVWEEYTSDYYVMDSYYREFHKNYAELQGKYNAELTELFELFVNVANKVEGFYATKFLSELGSNWANACADNLRDYGRVLDLPQQTDFYRLHVANCPNKAYVLVSDALRYEVAASLAEQLRLETQAEVTLKTTQGIFPTITKFGMAALLPHKKLSVELKSGKTERLAVLADGQSTEFPNRDKLLKAANAKSVALKYKDVLGMKRSERQALVKGMDVVYVYHDAIDQAGHSDSSVFAACDTAIEELKNMIRIITNEWGGTNIFITSDHGFLYTYSPLTEDDKVDKTTESDQDVEIGRRYAIMKKGAQPQYLMPVKFLGGDAPYDAFAPRESVRIKIKGGGLNFVHGGVSLQEMVVPVVEYHFLRNQNKKYLNNKSKYDSKPVEIALTSSERKICNMLFSLNFYQKEAVGGNREAATYQLYFTNGDGKIVSDVQKIIADKTSDNIQERAFRLKFNLKPLKFSNTEIYYLVVADENDMQIQSEEFQIDIAFAIDDFDFDFGV